MTNSLSRSNFDRLNGKKGKAGKTPRARGEKSKGQLSPGGRSLLPRSGTANSKTEVEVAVDGVVEEAGCGVAKLRIAGSRAAASYPIG